MRPLALLSVLALAAPVAAQQPPAKTALTAERSTTAEDVDLLAQRLERLQQLHQASTIDDETFASLRRATLSSMVSCAVSGTLKDVPIAEALEQVVAAAQRAGGRVSVVLAEADRALLSALRVTASFNGATERDAVRALLRLHEGSGEEGSTWLEWSEEGTVFVVRARKTEAEPDLPHVLIQPAPRAEPLPAPEEPQGRPWLGVSWDEVNPRGPGAGGVRLTAVAPGGPAAAAGLAPGDVILAVDDELVTSGEDLRNLLGSSGPGAVVTLRITRDGRTRDVVATLGVAPR